MTLGLYIHIPFCRKKCPYCDFYSSVYANHLASDYIDILSKEIEKINTRIDTVYIGGGTPTVLDISLWTKLLDALKELLASSSENTIEANPESIDKGKLKLFLKYNINRISLGIQSLNESKLKFLGRLHNAKGAINSVLEAKKYGFGNINIDLIYGLPGESLGSWQGELKDALRLPVTHVSLYSLICEPKTKFFRFKDKIHDEDVARMYLFNMSCLPKKSFFQYEVSNFARKGFECRHNLSYWLGSQYLGLGPSAASFVDGQRRKNISSIRGYIKRVKDNESTIKHREKLTPARRARELAALKIRTKAGVSLKDFKQISGYNFLRVVDSSAINELEKRGFLRLCKRKGKLHKVSLTKRGYLFCDEVSSSFV